MIFLRSNEVSHAVRWSGKPVLETSRIWEKTERLKPRLKLPDHGVWRPDLMTVDKAMLGGKRQGCRALADPGGQPGHALQARKGGVIMSSLEKNPSETIREF